MSLFNIVAVLITLSAVFSYLNHRFIRLPTTIGLMVISLLMSLSLILMDRFGIELKADAARLLASVEFDEALLGGMLSFLLFAGALHVNLGDLLEHKWVIGLLATFSVAMSTFLVGVSTFYVMQFLGVSLPFIYCLIFGALISPTDPIAVLAILKTIGAPKSLETKITGESLFNDGVGVVLFLVLVEIATGGGHITPTEIALLFGEEVLGGLLLGLASGYLAYRMLKSVDNYQVEIMITLALVAGGYALASEFHLSGPIAVVVSGLLIGNRGRLLAMSNHTREHLDTFWTLIDEILNAVLFVLIGLEILILNVQPNHLILSLLIIPIVVLARFISVGIPVSLLRPFMQFTPRTVRILTWGGLRGGISVALALSLAGGPERSIILPVTYAVVIFSIIVQGLTVGKLVARLPEPSGV